jgi:hypothetical protein
MSFVQRWQEEGMLYLSPKDWSDDFLLLYATVAFDDRLSLLVTNDEMRGHKNIFSEKHISHFKETHQMRYDLLDDSAGSMPEQTSPTFSLICPKLLSISLHEFESGKWHLPMVLDSSDSSQPDVDDTWLCLDLSPYQTRIPAGTTAD